MPTAPVSSRRIELTELRPAQDAAGIRAAASRVEADGDDLAVFLGTLPAAAGDILTRFTVRRPDIGADVGLACLSGADPAAAIQANLLLDAGATPHGMGLETTMLVLDHAFASWPARLVRFPVAAARARNFSLPAIISEETAPPDRQELPCEFRVFSIHRAPWEKFGTKLLTRLRRGPFDQ
ncbi:hypothetical protein OUY22_33735 [Nonomuraea sp. MCN248]|uniref:GNAT family N-acetyltransferase n=1 Tax=Nonomuraea corallina TaxID=2989783 RepID=A0ABT4SMB8_9ACTN|nr:hypothetical protein [Nonomuraea corallina]MDA0638394.1 hypothetical protein [Nonomuraea corallina]